MWEGDVTHPIYGVSFILRIYERINKSHSSVSIFLISKVSLKNGIFDCDLGMCSGEPKRYPKKSSQI